MTGRVNRNISGLRLLIADSKKGNKAKEYKRVAKKLFLLGKFMLAMSRLEDIKKREAFNQIRTICATIFFITLLQSPCCPSGGGKLSSILGVLANGGYTNPPRGLRCTPGVSSRTNRDSMLVARVSITKKNPPTKSLLENGPLDDSESVAQNADSCNYSTTVDKRCPVKSERFPGLSPGNSNGISQGPRCDGEFRDFPSCTHNCISLKADGRACSTRSSFIL